MIVGATLLSPLLMSAEGDIANVVDITVQARHVAFVP